MPRPNEEKVLFAFTPGSDAPDGVATLVFMMPQSAWEYMHTGLGHDFDLTKLGIPIKVVIGRCKNRKDGLEKLSPWLANAKKVADATGVDIGFKDGPQKKDS